MKTRLAKDIGAEKAARLYRELAEKNLEVLGRVSEPFRLVVAYDPPEKKDDVMKWLKPYRIKEYWPQKGAGLSERLANAFRSASRSNAKNYGPNQVLALGSDTMGLTPEIIGEGFDALDVFDCVLGPSEDGGYYLIGLSVEDGGIFENIPWSTSEVYQSTVRYLEREQLSYYRLPMLDDMDDIDDVRNLMNV